jgi:hypothetical protein
MAALKIPFSTDKRLLPENPGIYAIRNQNSDNVYIGSAGNLRLRFTQWQGPCYGSWRALFPYGEPEETTFSYEVTPDVTEARELERKIVRELARNPDSILLNTVIYKERLLHVTPRARKKLTANGMTLTVGEWARETGIKRETISGRLNKGWSTDQCLGFAPAPEPPHQGIEHPCAKPQTAFGVTDTIDGHARRHGIGQATLRMRLKRGMSLEQALKEPIRDYRGLKP